MDANDKGNAQAIIEAVQKLSAPELIRIGDMDGREVKALIVPVGKVAISTRNLLDEYRTAPERKTGTAHILEPHSFIEHVNRMKDEHSVLFARADKDNPSITAVYDYHQKDGAPRFGTHRAIYPFPTSDEWKAWLAMEGYARRMDQGAFAEFIEDRIVDLVGPEAAGTRTRDYVASLECELATPAQVAAMARGLSICVAQNVVNAVRLGSGETTMQFKEEHRDALGAPIKVPGAFLISIPIFKGGENAVLPVRLRYRVTGASVVWFYQLALVDALFQLAIDAEIKKIQAGVELPIYVGSPES